MGPKGDGRRFPPTQARGLQHGAGCGAGLLVPCTDARGPRILSSLRNDVRSIANVWHHEARERCLTAT